MRLDTFAMERMQSTWENLVDVNLSESGVHPLTLGELVDDEGARANLLAEGLRYTQSNGSLALRSAVAALYPGAPVEQIEVTNGGSEANYLATWHLVEPGDEVVLMVPNYMQTWGLARAFGATVREWPLRLMGAPARWTVDLAALDALVSAQTKLIIVCNPNNPTGARVTAAELDGIAAIAARHGTWVLSDEIYRGAERDGHETATLWGRYDRLIVTSGLSKAYGLPGLRIGWLVGPPGFADRTWACHDYTTICPGALSDALAVRALEPARRARILARTRGILNANYPVITAWLDAHGGLFSYAEPEAGAIVYARYHHPINSTALVNALRTERGVLVVPGDHFGMDGYLRLGYGDQTAHLHDGLDRIHAHLVSLGATA